MGSRRLVLMRHATAGGSGSGGDAARCLTPSGLAEAARVGRRLAERAFRPSAILCSTAVRCRETLDQVQSALPSVSPPVSPPVPPPVSRVDFEDRLYNASLGTLLDVLAEVEDGVDSLLLIAHNPGISQLAYELGRNDPLRQATLRAGFSPATTATFEVEGPWSGLSARTARLLDLERP